MRGAVAPIAALLLSVAILLMGNGLQNTLLPIRANLEAFTTFDIGVLGSSYFTGFAAGCLLGHVVISRVGHIRAFTAMVSIASAVALAHALATQPWVWWPLRATTGFCFATLYMIIESWLNERASNENRGTIFSIYNTINLTVITIGQMMITLGDPNNFPLFALASILVSVAAVPVALTTAPAPAPVGRVKIRLRRLYRVSPVGFAGCFAVGLASGAFWSLSPLFAERSGLSIAGIALFMSIAGIAGAMGQWPLGRLSDRMDRRKLIVLACAAAASAGVGMGVFNERWDQGILVFAFAYGIAAFPVYALSVAHANDFVEPGDYVATSSSLLLIYALGSMVGPLIASTAMSVVGADGLFGFTATVHTSLAIFVVLRMTRRAAVPEEERVGFAEAAVAAQTLSPVDPWQEDESEASNRTDAA